MTPDFAGLAEAGVGFVIVTGAASENDRPRYDFVSRFFAPGIGIPEDPVTGAAHCTLGPYWAERLGQDELSAYQASERGGEMQVRVAEERVHLGGKAITVLQGELVEEEGA
jgi:PhzF family phenazine biosynthesis protein